MVWNTNLSVGYLVKLTPAGHVVHETGVVAVVRAHVAIPWGDQPQPEIKL